MLENNMTWNWGICVWQNANISFCRVKSMSVATARSSVSRMASPSRCSCNERTPVALLGLFCTADSTARVSLRYDSTTPELYISRQDRVHAASLETYGDSHTAGRNHASRRRQQNLKSLSNRIYIRALFKIIIPNGLLTHSTGGRQEAHSPNRQGPACHRWCLSRCDQGAPYHAP